MSFVPVNPGDPIQAHQLNQVVNSLNGLAGAGQPVALTALSDASNYALTVQNLDPTNCRGLLVLKNDGTVLLRAACDGVSLGTPLNLTANSVAGAAIQDGSITNAKLGPDTARDNLLTNGGFEIWQRGNGPFTANAAYAADRWSLGLGGTDALSVARDTTNIAASGSSACAACTFTLGTGAGATNLSQVLGPTDYALSNTTLTLSMAVRTNVANAVRIGLWNGAWTYSAYHPGDGTYHPLAATLTMGVNQTLQVGVLFGASCTAYVDNCMLVVGTQAANYVPLHPADDLARALRYYERIDYAQNHSPGLVQGSGTGGFPGMSIPFKARKAVMPTVTSTAGWAIQFGNGAASTFSPSLLAAIDYVQFRALTSVTNGTVYQVALPSGPATLFAESNP